jgi:hypothetical protein
MLLRPSVFLVPLPLVFLCACDLFESVYFENLEVQVRVTFSYKGTRFLLSK